MNPTVPEAPDTSTPTPSRRQFLAFLALADLPVPESIAFHDAHPTRVTIDAGDNQDLAQLMKLFGAESHTVRRQRYDNDEYRKHGFILKVDHIPWQGWQIDLGSFADDGKTVPDLDLDAGTRTQLAVLAEAGADR